VRKGSGHARLVYHLTDENKVEIKNGHVRLVYHLTDKNKVEIKNGEDQNQPQEPYAKFVHNSNPNADSSSGERAERECLGMQRLLFHSSLDMTTQKRVLRSWKQKCSRLKHRECSCEYCGHVRNASDNY